MLSKLSDLPRNENEGAEPTGGEWVARGSHICSGDTRIAFADNDVAAAVDGKQHDIGPREARANALVLAASKELLAACKAAIAYDVAIQRYARDGRVDLRQDGSGIATGDDLDSLYDAWISASRTAIAKARGDE